MLDPMAASKDHFVPMILTLTPYSMAEIDWFFAKTNKAQGMKYLIKDADHAQLHGPNEYALISGGSSPFHLNDVSPTTKIISHRIFGALPAATETIQYRQLCRSPSLIIITIMNSYSPMSSKVNLSGVTKPRD